MFWFSGKIASIRARWVRVASFGAQPSPKRLGRPVSIIALETHPLLQAPAPSATRIDLHKLQQRRLTCQLEHEASMDTRLTKAISFAQLAIVSLCSVASPCDSPSHSRMTDMRQLRT